MILTRCTSACGVSGAKGPARPNSEIRTILSGKSFPSRSSAGARPAAGPCQLPKYWFIIKKSVYWLAFSAGSRRKPRPSSA